MFASDVRLGMPVMATDGLAGRVSDVLIAQPSGQIAWVVVSADGFFQPDVVIAPTLISHVADGTVFVTSSSAALRAMLPYDAARHGPGVGMVSLSASAYDAPRQPGGDA